MSKQWGFTTKAIHGGKMPDVHKAVAPPIYQTATFYYDTAEEGARLGQEIPPGYIYTRWANPKLRFVETPNNPMLGITEIEAVAALAHTRGAAAIADNTWATPYNQTPLTLGADVVVHSATKYLGGHHDVTAGVIVGRAEFI